MNKVFAENDPVLEAGDRTTQTGKDIHSGTRFLFAGAMAALRNPKAHENNVFGLTYLQGLCIIMAWRAAILKRSPFLVMPIIKSDHLESGRDDGGKCVTV